jgi:hypothetical protein
MGEPSQERLDGLDEQIQGARRQAEEDNLAPEEDGSTLIDPDNDGQTEPEGMEIAPG